MNNIAYFKLKITIYDLMENTFNILNKTIKKDISELDPQLIYNKIIKNRDDAIKKIWLMINENKEISKISNILNFDCPKCGQNTKLKIKSISNLKQKIESLEREINDFKETLIPFYMMMGL